MSYTETRPCCGNKTTAYFHPINKLMVHAFEKMVEKYLETRKPVNLEKDLSLTYSQNCNFQKMKHFGIIFFADKGWLPTKHGLEFYRCNAPIYDVALSISNQSMPHNHPAWNGRKRTPKLVYIEDIVGLRYKNREEYAIDKAGQTSLLDN